MTTNNHAVFHNRLGAWVVHHACIPYCSCLLEGRSKSSFGDLLWTHSGKLAVITSCIFHATRLPESATAADCAIMVLLMDIGVLLTVQRHPTVILVIMVKQ